MTLKELLRSDFANYVRPHFEKSECECCGSDTERLHVHHVTHFQDLLDETLKILQLEYHDDTDMYSDNELQLIREVMLGKQMTIQYVTCCEPCRLELHDGSYNSVKGKEWAYKANEAKRQKKQLKDLQEQQRIKQLESYLESLIDVKLDMEQKNELIEEIQAKDKRGRLLRTPKAINQWLNENGVDYIIESKRTEKRINGNRQRLCIWSVKLVTI